MWLNSLPGDSGAQGDNMTSVLIADTCKCSIVITSEIFKDRIPGANIIIAGNGQECLDAAGQGNFDMVLLDFDLPDSDAVTLTRLLRKRFDGPILITAFPDNVAKTAIETELFSYNDSLDWVAKPVSAEKLSHLIQKYLLEKKRVQKRYSTEMEAVLSSKGSNSAKRAPKVRGNIVNLSAGGAMLNLEQKSSLRPGEEVSLTIYHAAKNSRAGSAQKLPPGKLHRPPELSEEAKARARGAKPTLKPGSFRLKARIAWADTRSRKAGLSFYSLTDHNIRVIESLLKSSAELAGYDQKGSY